jgi:hypothetical protein
MRTAGNKKTSFHSLKTALSKMFKSTTDGGGLANMQASKAGFLRTLWKKFVSM